MRTICKLLQWYHSLFTATRPEELTLDDPELSASGIQSALQKSYIFPLCGILSHILLHQRRKRRSQEFLMTAGILASTHSIQVQSALKPSSWGKKNVCKILLRHHGFPTAWTSLHLGKKGRPWKERSSSRERGLQR